MGDPLLILLLKQHFMLWFHLVVNLTTLLFSKTEVLQKLQNAMPASQCTVGSDVFAWRDMLFCIFMCFISSDFAHCWQQVGERSFRFWFPRPCSSCLSSHVSLQNLTKYFIPPRWLNPVWPPDVPVCHVSWWCSSWSVVIIQCFLCDTLWSINKQFLLYFLSTDWGQRSESLTAPQEFVATKFVGEQMLAQMKAWLQAERQFL